ncbi:hypothetical protein [Rhodopseudomonas sp. RCAM05734]|uniref:hypothetical protein n=1 Tax=Rhodopseudomonas sp. RCAM05734 TaxID=3457549 RepID=UPI00404483B0
MTKLGVFAISRKLMGRDDPFFGDDPFSRREAWQWLIAEAAWKPRKVNVGAGRGATVVSLERGRAGAQQGLHAAGLGMVVGESRSDFP